MTAEVTDLNKVRRRHTRKRIITLSLVAVTSVIAVWAVFFSPYLIVKDVVVTGEFYASADEIVQAAGIEDGQPLARIDAAAISRRVTEISAVLSVEVRRVWPQQVILAVRERKPVAVSVAADGWTLVDATGVRFGSLTIKPAGLLVISGNNNRSRMEAALVAGSLPQWLVERVVSIRGYSRDDVRLTLDNEDVVRWGSSDKASAKIDVLEVLLDLEARVYDVSAPEMPVTRT